MKGVNNDTFRLCQTSKKAGLKEYSPVVPGLVGCSLFSECKTRTQSLIAKRSAIHSFVRGKDSPTHKKQ